MQSAELYCNLEITSNLIQIMSSKISLGKGYIDQNT